MQLSWQMEKILQEINEATGTPDGQVHIPFEMLIQVIKMAVNEGQLDAFQDALKRLKEAKRLELEMLGAATPAIGRKEKKSDV